MIHEKTKLLTMDVEVAWKIGVQQNGKTEWSSFCDPLDLQTQWLEPGPQRFHEENIVFLGSGNKGTQFSNVASYGLFAKNMFSCFDSLQRILIMQRVWGT